MSADAAAPLDGGEDASPSAAPAPADDDMLAGATTAVAAPAETPATEEAFALGVADTMAGELPSMGDVAPSDQPTQPARAGQGARPARDDADTLLDPLIGKTLLGRYRITGKLGQGGMGAVYEAEHTLIGKRVAVKVLLDKYAQRDPVVARLEQEARLASSIGHEHIIDITDFGQTSEGRPFVVMEYLDGESLGACLSREGSLPELRAIRIAQQAASALAAAHAKGILHRDVKPENIFLLRRRDLDFVKVVDFGISKSLHTGEEEGSTPRLTQTGMVLGTPLYMSPEQARGEDDLDQRIDVYALGVILYEMVTGEVPFRGSNSLNIISRVINDEAPPPRERRPDLSPELEAVILHAMAKDPNQRYASCELLAADLGALDAELSGERGLQTTGRLRLNAPPPRYLRRRGLNGLRWAGGMAGIGAVAIVTVWMLMAGANEVAPTAALVPGPDAATGAQSAAPTPDARPGLAEIEIVTQPAGAAIFEGDRLRGHAPLSFRTARADAPIELTAELDGHEPASFTVHPVADDQQAVVVRLIPAKEPAEPRRAPRTSPPAESEPAEPDHSGTAAGELGGNPYRRSE
ncbi:protein kinase domain-containing protein [Haliangium sp.]|uniref:serine/threonine-protein kinase n=1 Tax=Haliangium sp. TaxID=2663208 RepID=UPI003D0FC700